jgi:hypothetical protein
MNLWSVLLALIAVKCRYSSNTDDKQHWRQVLVEHWRQASSAPPPVTASANPQHGRRLGPSPPNRTSPAGAGAVWHLLSPHQQPNLEVAATGSAGEPEVDASGTPCGSLVILVSPFSSTLQFLPWFQARWRLASMILFLLCLVAPAGTSGMPLSPGIKPESQDRYLNLKPFSSNSKTPTCSGQNPN